MHARLTALATALVVAVGLLVAGTVAPATAASSRCAAWNDVVRETAPGQPFAGRTPLLAASYNIGGYNAAKSLAPWESRAGKVVSMILRCSPDVIGLQEATGAWMQRRALGQRNYAQYEHVVDLMNSRTTGSPYRVTNTYRDNCTRTGRNPAVWNGTWKGRAAPWHACTTSPRLSSSDNRTVYDSRVLEVVSTGSRHLSSATSNQRTLDWTVFRHRASGKRFLFANTHLEARYGGAAVGAAKSNTFRRKEAAQIIAALRQVRVSGGATLPIVQVGDMNSSGRIMARTPVDDMTSFGLADALGTDRRVYRSKKSAWRGSCASVGVTSSLKATGNIRVPLHVKRRINASYNSSNAVAGKNPGSGVNTCMFKDKKHKKPRGSTPGAYYRHQGTRIDYILASPTFRARGWETVVDADLRRARYRSTPPSDHNMVAATLAF